MATETVGPKGDRGERGESERARVKGGSSDFAVVLQLKSSSPTTARIFTRAANGDGDGDGDGVDDAGKCDRDGEGGGSTDGDGGADRAADISQAGSGFSSARPIFGLLIRRENPENPARARSGKYSSIRGQFAIVGRVT